VKGLVGSRGREDPELDLLIVIVTCCKQQAHTHRCLAPTLTEELAPLAACSAVPNTFGTLFSCQGAHSSAI
jgi:hypothetical protein